MANFADLLTLLPKIEGRAKSLIPLLDMVLKKSPQAPLAHFSSPIGPENRPPTFRSAAPVHGPMTAAEFASLGKTRGERDKTFAGMGRTARDIFNVEQRQKREAAGAADRKHAAKGKTARAFFDVAKDKEGAVSLSAFTKKAAFAGKMLGAVGVAIATFKLPGQIKRWGESLIESQRHLGQFSGTIARSLGEFERRKLIRTITTAGATGRSTDFLSESISDLSDALRPVQDTLINALNLVGGSLAQIVTLWVRTQPLLNTIGDLSTVANSLLDWLQGKDETERELGDFQEFLKDAKEGRLKPFDVGMPPR